MTLTRVLNAELTAGTLRGKAMTFVGPASYTTGGISLLPGDAGIGKTFVSVSLAGIVVQAGTTVLDAVYNFATQKLIMIGTSGAEISNAVDLSAGTFQLLMFGY